MTGSVVRVLLVDDFLPFRRYVSSMLRDLPDFEIVGEAADGLEAVRQAEELKPCLILLDIGLPKMNGIEAAPRIRSVSPGSRILFISQNRSLETAQAALATGALGYVIKSHAARELLSAMRAVVRGERFVSERITGELS